jgi:NAD(P)-dependent dehydrogenase (short-subunit alcohol dehydrogenase family)
VSAGGAYSSPSSLFDLTGRVCFVTGGSRGLGASIARTLAAAGANVVIASRSIDACRDVAKEITQATGHEALPLQLHVGRWDDLQPAVDAAWTHFGRLDVLVNNAGMSPVYDDVLSITESLFDKVVDVNLKGPFRLAVAAAQRMAGSGSIINITSMGAVRPRPDILPYAAAKAGLNALTIGLARTFGPEIRCNAIMAGTFATDVSRYWDPAVIQARAAAFAAHRVGEPEEIAGAALYLASDASSYTTGSIIAVDGGQP